MTVRTYTRIRDNGKIEYWCSICGVWDVGQLWNGTGYTNLICTGCDATLVEDVDRNQEYENSQRKDGKP